jgi:hypothetical protein
VVLGALVVFLTGCETLHSRLRPADSNEMSGKEDDDPNKPKSVDSDVSKMSSVNSTDTDSKPFFKKTRPSSSWSPFSPEAREIEKDLGVY